MKDERLKFIVRKDQLRKKDGKYPINIRVTMSSKVLKLSTGICMELGDWNFQSGFPKKRNDLNKYKSRLKRKMRVVEDFIEDCEKYGKSYSLDDIKDHYSNGNKETFFDYYDNFCNRKSKDIQDESLYIYEVLGKQLREYAPNLKLGNITYDFIQDFFTYLKTEKGVNNLFNKKKCLVAFLTEMKKGGHVKKNIVSEVSIGRQPLKEIFLTKEEQEAFCNVTLFHDGQRVTQDVFEFCCYTGLRYGDAFSLSKKNIVNGILRIRQEKVKTFVDIPLQRRPLEILKKYDYLNSENTIFPFKSNQVCNRDVKIIANNAGIFKNLTFHVSRHTFGTRLAENGVNAFIIQKLMGHGSIKTTERYIKTSKEILSEAMETVDFV